MTETKTPPISIDEAKKVIAEIEAKIEEQRQEMLHAGMATALADRLIERVAACIGAERSGIRLAEAPDRLARQRHLAHRHEERKPAPVVAQGLVGLVGLTEPFGGLGIEIQL